MKVRKKLKKIFIGMSFLTISAFSMAAGENYSDYKALLIGDTKGNIYRESNGNSVRPLASVTKVMTSLVILDKVNNGEFSFDTKVTISKKAASVPYGITLVAGRQYTVRDLLKATIIRSSNNAAYALAEFAGNGDVNTFISMMNGKAKDLGLYSLKYCSPHGLPPSYTGSCMDEGNARDLYKLASIAVQYPDYINISRNAADYIDYGSIKLSSTNTLLGKVIGVDGLKTGYHNAAGSNIILTAQRNQDRMIAVILGSQRAANRNAIGTREINNYYVMPKNPINVVSLPANDVRSSLRITTNVNNSQSTASSWDNGIDPTRNNKNTSTTNNVWNTNNNTTTVNNNVTTTYTNNELNNTKSGIMGVIVGKKIVDKNVSFATIVIEREQFRLYPKEDKYEKGNVGTLTFKVTSLKTGISAADRGQEVGTYTATDGKNEYHGSIIMR